VNQTVAVIGYGTAAINAAIALRQAGYRGCIRVFSATDLPPYSPILTSYYAAGEISYEDCFPWDAEQIALLDLDVRSNCPVMRLDAKEHLLETSYGVFSYDKCLIASGASPMVKGFPAIGGYDPLVLRTMDDARRFKEALTQIASPRVLVSGTSMVALKAVEACIERGARVTLLGRGSHILRHSALVEVAEAFEQSLASRGVELRFDQAVLQAGLKESGLIEAEFSSGDSDLFTSILIAHGMRPNLQFLSPDSLEGDLGVLVDANMRTSDPDIFAAGDVAQAADLVTRTYLPSGLWREACLQGACAGRAIAADLAGVEVPRDAAYPGSVRNNSISVCGATLLAGGSVRLGSDRQVELEKWDFGLVGRIYAARDDNDAAPTRHLVGYNVFSPDCKPGDAAYDEAEQLLRQLKIDLINRRG
jgi:NADPH-dependent 2,4-dienoyl-CoA reductase/sulfur reductase-like enzyme